MSPLLLVQDECGLLSASPLDKATTNIAGLEGVVYAGTNVEHGGTNVEPAGHAGSDVEPAGHAGSDVEHAATEVAEHAGSDGEHAGIEVVEHAKLEVAA